MPSYLVLSFINKQLQTLLAICDQHTATAVMYVAIAIAICTDFKDILNFINLTVILLSTKFHLQILPSYSYSYMMQIIFENKMI